MMREEPKENLYVKSCDGYIFINIKIEKQLKKKIHSLVPSKGLSKG